MTTNTLRFLKFGILKKIAMCWLALFSADVKASAVSATTLKISQDEAYSTMASYAEIRTFVSDALRPLGINMTVISLPLERANIASSKGEIDGQLARVPEILNKYPQLNRTSFPLIYITVRIMYLKSNKNFDEQDLGKYIGAGPLNNYGIVTKDLHYTQVFNPKQAISMLESGRIDYVLLPETIIQDCLTESPRLEKIVNVSKRAFITFPLYFILNKKNSHLLPQIEKAFRESLSKNRFKYSLIKESLNPNP